MSDVFREAGKSEAPPILDPNYLITGPIMVVHRKWFEQPGLLALRLHDLIVGLDVDRPYQKENGHWVLDGGNNWFLRIENAENGEIQISYRYAKTREFWSALKLIVEDLL